MKRRAEMSVPLCSRPCAVRRDTSRARTASASQTARQRTPASRTAGPRARSGWRAGREPAAFAGRERPRKPPHPGAILRDKVLPALRLSQQAFADRVGVSRETVNALVGERRDLSADLAVRIARLLGHSAERWMALQTALDVWRVAKAGRRERCREPLARSVPEV